jgi:hypothetical protein
VWDEAGSCAGECRQCLVLLSVALMSGDRAESAASCKSAQKVGRHGCPKLDLSVVACKNIC